jgi:hypothetical protein
MAKCIRAKVNNGLPLDRATIKCKEVIEGKAYANGDVSSPTRIHSPLPLALTHTHTHNLLVLPPGTPPQRIHLHRPPLPSLLLFHPHPQTLTHTLQASTRSPRNPRRASQAAPIPRTQRGRLTGSRRAPNPRRSAKRITLKRTLKSTAYSVPASSPPSLRLPVSAPATSSPPFPPPSWFYPNAPLVDSVSRAPPPPS